MHRTLIAVAGLVGAMAIVGAGEAKPSSKGVEGALVRCADVAVPAAPTGCGTDPLHDGSFEVTKGGFELDVRGAQPGATYEVVLQSLDGTTSTSVGVFTTNGDGRGELERKALFDLGQAAMLKLLVVRGDNTQFVAGFGPASGGEGEEDDANLSGAIIPCGAVNVPVTLAGCGTDALGSGEFDVNDHRILVRINGAPVSSSYGVVLRSFTGSPGVSLGTLVTDAMGRGVLEVNLSVLGGGEHPVGAGNIVLTRNGADQYISGFKTDARRKVGPAKYGSALVRCADVNQLTDLSGCGDDLFNKGFAAIDDSGNVKVNLFGAVPGVDYQVTFVSFDGSLELPLGTLTTNPAGNGEVTFANAFAVGSVGAGNVVLSRGGADQFVTGFRVVK